MWKEWRKNRHTDKDTHTGKLGSGGYLLPLVEGAYCCQQTVIAPGEGLARLSRRSLWKSSSQTVNIQDEEEATVAGLHTPWSLIHTHSYLDPKENIVTLLSYGETALPIFYKSEALGSLSCLCPCQQYTSAHSRFPPFPTGSQGLDWL